MRAAALALLLAAAGCSSVAEDGLAPLVATTLHVTVAGLPAGAAAEVTVTGPDGRVRRLAGTTDLADLVPGSYTIAAAPVAAGADSLRPVPARQEVAVADGAEPTEATVTYVADAGGLDLTIAAVTVTQVIQSLSDSIPLVAGRDALVRVFVRANLPATAMPTVRLRLYGPTSATPLGTWTIPAPTASVPLAPVEGDLATTWNQLVPGALLTPGVRLLADVDPENAVAEGIEADNSFPASGVPRTLDVRTVPPLAVRFVPVRTAATGATGAVSAANQAQFLVTFRKLFPVATVSADVRATTYTTTTRDTLEPRNGNNAWVTILSEVNALRAAEGFAGTYYGVVRTGYGSGIAGMGYVPGRAAIGWDRLPSGDDIAAHELGHTLSLSHAPCGGAAGTDPRFPFADGTTGITGVDLATMTVRPGTDHDIMGYCASDWIGAYHYLKALQYQQSGDRASLVLATAPEPGLLVWGRIVDGRVTLEPAFEVTAPPLLPSGRGGSGVELLDAQGRVLWSAAFEGEPVAHAEGDQRHFAFVIPLRRAGDALAAVRVRDRAGAVERRSPTSAAVSAASDRLAFARAQPDTRAALAAAQGATRLTWDASSWPMAMVRDAATGAILSLARGGEVALEAPGRALDVTFSDGARSATSRLEVR